ncbi:MAG: hypothetical protein P4L57_16695 [Rhizomicrobium sp.]|nr:hypothetical protein [Rhizomicrobium sp.]
MLVGHIGIGLAAKAIEPRMKLGTMLVAALALDIVFFLLVLAGIEHIAVPRDYGVSHLLSFDFPYSHSLLGSILLAVVIALAWALWGGRRARRHGAYWDGIALIAVTVLTHWFLDLIVHTPDLPLYPGGEGYGIGLWRHPAAALILELAVAVAGFVAFALRSQLHWGRKLTVGIMAAVIACFTAEGAFGQMGAPDASAIALSGLLVIALAVGLAAFADRSRRSAG